ncbi:hypothetical protein M409DRAFT_22026 [Zasmidium cellare ATCC 36951]|uniref:Uncharacterized protein n=1 Tax=Zasmidium cellare ATCC 36951 TaxID=1080233 RepID=A0A6A6CNR4_ZASCE|nr:uncharacterized protein M409DRAFT_22026 [Zasmidium cellare ATCC 36951]KAF2167878.1 hypothetical protein M409DRAFT_22026 [Zasmidium cellare ATCC 36951]
MLSSTLLAVLGASLAQATTPWPANVPQPAVTYCTSTLTVPYSTPCTPQCVTTVTKTAETTSLDCAGCRYLATSTSPPEDGLGCPIAACAAPIPTFWENVNTTTSTVCHETTPWPGAGPSKK